jgi:UDP-N-acetyl-D-mannosaminuronic acid dehydrogenase
MVKNDRAVGGLDTQATEKGIAFYSQFVTGQLLPSDAPTAEMVKLVENASRDVQIAFANELSLACDHMGIDVWDVISLANHHPRVNILNPGPGVGGHCIAVDPWFIIDAAPGDTPLMRVRVRLMIISRTGWSIRC